MPEKIFDLQIAPGSHTSTTVVAVRGALILEHIFSFQDAWRSANTDNLIFDLTNVSYIDSAAIGSLVNAQVSCMNKQKKMALAGVPDRVHKILNATRVEGLFKFFPDAQTAEEGLRGASTAA